MVKAKEKEKEREKDQKAEKKMFVGIIWNCAADIKHLLTALLFLCSIITIFQFLPSRLSFSFFRPHHCILESNIPVSTKLAVVAERISPPPPPPPPPLPPPLVTKQDEVLEGGIIKRAFNPYGAAAYNFILMSAYRGGLNTFAINALASKPLHVFGNPTYHCEWVPNSSNTTAAAAAAENVTTAGFKILPDWGYGRVYTVVVVNCTFPIPVGSDDGGKLLVHASTNGFGDTNFNIMDTIEALYEAPGSLNPSLFTSTPKYDYLYCGSSLYGNLSPQRVREWLAYHIRMFGPKSHFVIHDAGGVHPDVMEVLKPWMEKGYVTLQDIKDQERFDGYYHNQFLIVNDCLHRYRFAAKWMFFFDVDEFIFLPKKSTIKSVTDSLSDFTQFTIQQMTMSNKLCLSEDSGKTHRKWGFEKLVYKDTKRGIRRDRKYAVQPRNVFATGVHLSQNIVGKTNHRAEGGIMYYHYHGTISERSEPCKQLINTTDTILDGTPYILDTSMRKAAGSVKKFELKMIGDVLQRTRQ